MKYLTIEEGKDYRKIAKIMTAAGFKMNHATARNIFFSSMRKFFVNLCENLQIEKDKNVDRLMKDQYVHDLLVDVLHKAFMENKLEIQQKSETTEINNEI
jgi:ketopantoate reductase